SFPPFSTLYRVVLNETTKVAERRCVPARTFSTLYRVVLNETVACRLVCGTGYRSFSTLYRVVLNETRLRVPHRISPAAFSTLYRVVLNETRGGPDVHRPRAREGFQYPLSGRPK